MTLVERYVRAVRDFLPRGQQDDITNELSDSIQSRFEDEAAARGRPLTEDEQVAILRSLGHPMAVAARYRGDDRSVRFGRSADRTGALPDVPHGPSDQPGDHPDHRRRLTHRRWIDLVGDRGRRRPVRHPVHDRHARLHLGRAPLAARPGRLGPAHGQLDGPGRRRVDARWARGPADRQAAHARGRDHDVRARDRPAGDCAHGLACDRTSRADRVPEAGSRLDRRVARGHRRDPVRARHPGRQPVPADLDALPGRRPRADGHRLDRDPRGFAHARQLGRPRRSGHVPRPTSRTSSS